jgi:hypothetical protein
MTPALDPHPDVGGHVAVVVDHAGDGLRTDAGLLGHVTHGRHRRLHFRVGGQYVTDVRVAAEIF